MADTFTLDLARFAEKAADNIQTVVKRVATDLFSQTVDRTPVGNPKTWKGKAPAGYVGGRLRANWNPSIDTPNNTTTTSVDPGGEATKARIRATVGNWTQGDIYLMNSLPYVHKIEYGVHSSQAPKGMVRITVTEFQTYVAAAVAGLPQ